MPFSYPVTNSVDTGLIFEVSCGNKLWRMDPKSERNQSRPNEKQREGLGSILQQSLYNLIRLASLLYRVPTCGL